jgi:hypothetical protein
VVQMLYYTAMAAHTALQVAKVISITSKSTCQLNYVVVARQ